jgi:hypothetical protein
MSINKTGELQTGHFGLGRKLAFKSPDKARLHFDTQDRLAALQQQLGGSYDVLVSIAVRHLYANAFCKAKASIAASEVGQASHEATSQESAI